MHRLEVNLQKSTEIVNVSYMQFMELFYKLILNLPTDAETSSYLACSLEKIVLIHKYHAFVIKMIF